MDLPKVLTAYATREEGWRITPDPELYAEFATPNQKVNAAALIRELSWSYQNDVILDIGCNNGDVTKMLLSQSDHIQHITACDILGPCINYAKEKNDDPRISYLELDVSKEWPNWESKYDKVFSNECLNMISDQETVLKQVFKSLRPGGEFGASYFLQVEGHQTAILSIMEKEKWSKYFQGPKKSEIIATANENIMKMIWSDKENFSKILEDIGFEVKICRNIQAWYFPNDLFHFLKNVYLLFTNVMDEIPSSLHDEFILENVPIFEEIENKKFQLLSKQGCKSNQSVQDVPNKKHALCTELMIVHCFKPNNSTL